jgi:hypothetical protein
MCRDRAGRKQLQPSAWPLSKTPDGKREAASDLARQIASDCEKETQRQNQAAWVHDEKKKNWPDG